MTRGTLVLLGKVPVDQAALEFHAAEYGWSLTQCPDIDGLRELSAASSPVAVIFDAPSLGCSWTEGVKRVLDSAPETFPIACHGFSDQMDWTALANAGAFHALVRPLESGEVRRSFGYVWAARKREAEETRSLVASESTPRRRLRKFAA